MPIRVVVTASRIITREGLRTMLESAPDITVVSVADCAIGNADACRATPVDVAVLDLPSSEEAIRALRMVCPDGTGQLRVIVMYHGEGPRVASSLLAEGASGLVSHDADTHEMIIAIQAAMRGHVYLTPCLTGDLLVWTRSHEGRADPHLKSRVDVLTRREREVLATLARGASLDEAARKLFISHATIRTHVYRIQHKVGARDRAELVSFAFRSGLINSQSSHNEEVYAA